MRSKMVGAAVKASTYNGDAHTVEWVMSAETKDRDGEIISAKGWSVPGDAPLLWGHMSHSTSPEAVLGRVIGARVDGKSFVGTLLFSQANPAAQLAEKMVAEGILTNGSVGFEPMEWADKDGTIGARVRGGQYPHPQEGRTYTKAELVEFSIVPVPSNADAMVRMCKALEHIDPLAIEIVNDPNASPADLGAVLRELRLVRSSLDQLLGVKAAAPEQEIDPATMTAVDYFSQWA
ncbi:MAG TPA: HK97 family phage prohead protease [Phycisphaerae bacterium]|nr:HK97 family phage prohead protease [Phycisphaerae bacterium]